MCVPPGREGVGVGPGPRVGVGPRPAEHQEGTGACGRCIWGKDWRRYGGTPTAPPASWPAHLRSLSGGQLSHL